MRAAVLQAYGEDPVLGDFDEPGAGTGQVVVDVLAAGLNPIDLRTASGALADRSPPLPSVVGSEGIGRTPEGTRVYFSGCVAPHGSLAQRTLVEAASLVEVPPGVEDAHAVCFGIAGTAAWGALTRRGAVRDGDTVLVLGASGVVGMIAVQAAKLLGAARVVAAARSEDGLRRAAELGADATVRLEGSGAELTEAFTTAAGGPVDLVIDPLWGEPAAAAVEALAMRGRLVQLGQSAGDETTLRSVSVRFKELSILGYTNFASTREEQAESLRRLWEHAAAGQLVADHETLPLDQAVEAWRRQAASPGRKLVVVP
jgi:NADPH2:quinone reductase